MKDSVDMIIDAWRAERPDVAPDAMGIVGRISRLSRIMEATMEADYAQFGLSGPDFDVLATLRRGGAPYELTPTQLYRASMLSSGAMTNRLDRLEQKFLIARRPDPEDRRGIRVSLTPRGLSVVDAALVSHVACEERMLIGLTPDDRRSLESLLRALLINHEGPAAG